MQKRNLKSRPCPISRALHPEWYINVTRGKNSPYLHNVDVPEFAQSQSSCRIISTQFVQWMAEPNYIALSNEICHPLPTVVSHPSYRNHRVSPVRFCGCHAVGNGTISCSVRRWAVWVGGRISRYYHISPVRLLPWSSSLTTRNGIRAISRPKRTIGLKKPASGHIENSTYLQHREMTLSVGYGDRDNGMFISARYEGHWERTHDLIPNGCLTQCKWFEVISTALLDNPSGTLSETWAILVFDVDISWFIHEIAYDLLNHDEPWFQHNVHMVNRVQPRSAADDKINKQSDKRAGQRRLSASPVTFKCYTIYMSLELIWTHMTCNVPHKQSS